MRVQAAIAGLGVTPLSRRPGPPALTLAADAVGLATADAGLALSDVDGLLVVTSPVAPAHRIDLSVARRAGLRDLRLLSLIGGEGTGAVQALQLAAWAVSGGPCRAVVCVFADTPLADRPEAAGRSGGGPGGGATAFGQSGIFSPLEGLDAAYGAFGWVTAYAMAASRYLDRYGAPEDVFAPIVLAQRNWAQRNPQAMVRTPLTHGDYLASRWVVEPFRLLDCALPVNGGIAVLVVPARMAPDLAQPPVYLLGIGQAHPGRTRLTALDVDGAGVPAARAAAFAAAGVGVNDIDACEFYDPFSYVTLARLEDYGFCGPGEGADFVADGRLGPGGALPANTGGGHLSGYYLQGMTPVAEAVTQARGQAGERQLPRHDVLLVTGDGGVLDHHACLLLSPRQP
jgi:acetyl-CoA acetyltransferase